MLTAGRVIGLLALVTAAGAGCGTSGSSSTPKVSVGAAAGKPCLLVSLSEATTILGQGAVTNTLPPTGNAPTACSFGLNLTTVLVQIIPVPFAESPADYISTPAPAAGVGHGAVCGPGVNLTGYLSALVGPLDSGHSLLVDGLASCAIEEKFAAVAYSHLQE
jgi:hypothetical protein